MSRSRSSEIKTWTLPASFKNLTALNYFNLEAENLKEIPTFLKEMTNLEQLTLLTTDANLPELPTSLKHLILNAPNLIKIPAHVGSLTQLFDLIISHNLDGDDFMLPIVSKLTSIEVDFSRFTTLNTVRIEAGPECPIPSSLWNCSTIRNLDLIGFNMQIPSSLNLPVLKDLVIANIEVSPATLEGIKNLKLKYLRLVTPQLGKNGLPDWLGTMSSLYELTLDSCNISVLPNSLDGLKNLAYLDIEHNTSLTGQLPAGLLQQYLDRQLRVSSHSPRTE